ncbi:hypothetical protein B0T17DRAFT_338218 [Bombardia bombarda]|uniref:Heavy metal tolerance protein n=1 Tax=Bombardia bombarda TaxID=252184 RepID=A0AA39WN17_9PEZI|nr:hypothetical protein B0T17DRAFT_338218 [Bombardia bombarda]
MLGPDDGAMAHLVALPQASTALVGLHYTYPTAIFVYYVVSLTVAVCALQTKSTEEFPSRRRAILWLLLLAILTYFAQLLNIIVQALIRHEFPSEQDTIIGFLSCILVYGVEFAGLSDSLKPVWYPYIGSFGLALVFETTIQVLTFMTRPDSALTYAEFFDISAVGTRYLAFVVTLAYHIENVCRGPKQEKGSDAERQSLLKTNGAATPDSSDDQTVVEQADGQESGYGATSDSSTDTSQGTSTDASQSSASTETPELHWERRERQANEQMEKRLKEKGNWIKYAKSFLILFPYIWPVNNRPLQTRIILVGFCLLAMNLVNVLIPRQLGIVMDSLGGLNNENPWTQVILYAFLKLIASEAGLSLLRQWLWIPVEYYTDGAMSTAAYSHVLNLSSDFHDTKSSSDIMMAMQSGSSISNMLESVCFQAIPMLIDMSVAFIYLSVTFGPYEGFITIATATLFLYITTQMISRMTGIRKKEVRAYYKEHYVRQAGIQGWSTVTCFNQIEHEASRYSTVVKDRVALSQKVLFGHILSSAFQFLVLISGLLAGAFLAVYQVTHSQATPGQFIMLLTYWAQLVAPLSFFAGLSKSISSNLLQAEQLLNIMMMKPSISNKEGAPPLQFTKGAVEFKDVCFSYDKKKDILKDITFTASPGQTVAFVGATGAGKSTILKLLDRFYDVTSGSIEIDGQDIRDVDLFSLRARIGIVPQSPILFDDTIMNNVRYAKLDASDEDVHKACKAASIHEQILSFTDGYNSRVGERGIKLSGGELQRVAIARAILKQPSIVLLDEATSAVDTETEQKIQEALRVLCEGRTTFVVAHRLSTIMNADHIIVIMGGQLVEQGAHGDLIGANGKYAELWSKQIFAKPKDKESTTDDDDDSMDKSAVKARKEAPDIFNDLTQERTNSELAKVKSVSSLRTLGGSGTSEPTEDGGSSADESSSETKRTLESKKEV